MLLEWGSTRISIIKGDITDQAVDAIVNAANSSLMGGGGVDGAIHRRGGPKILEECRAIRRDRWPDGLPSGEAVITTGGLLKARYVIHMVGPVWKGGNDGEAETLAKCYRNSLTLALDKRLSSVAFPSISTGAYGYPIGEASRVALGSVREFTRKYAGPEEVVLILFREEDLSVYETAAREL